MSAHEQATAAILAQVAFAGDGAVLGLALAYVAVRCIVRFSVNSSSLRKLKPAPSLSVSDLRTLLFSSDDQGKEIVESSEKLVVVRGTVEPKSAVEANWKNSRPVVVVSPESGDVGVILQRSQKCIYNEWRGFFGWASDLRTIFARAMREQESTTLRMVPFVLAEGGESKSDYIVVNLEGSSQPLPLTTVYQQLRPINASPYTFLQALFGHEYPVGLLDEEKILPVGKNINAVGICCSKDGIFEIKSCKDLPFFLSDKSKNQMVEDLAFRTKVQFWSGVFLGSLSIGILAYAIVRNWNKLKQWRQQRRIHRRSQSSTHDEDTEIRSDEDEARDIPDGELCVVCLTRRRRSVFIPCGHLVCCHRCARSVEREQEPLCPVCRQTIRDSVRIYGF